ncbi:3-dehydroquinate synthase [Faunimonas sp. B44]|uniref:3-dehydroquinate synthase n=1 Tax=Faunimonas sp. B44 TaxID=3461493 RepID=UPI0040442E7B
MTTDERTDAVVRVELGSRSYDILIGSGLIAEAGMLVRDRLGPVRLAIVTDENVAAAQLQSLLRAFRAADLDATTIVMPPGEATKSMRHLETVVDEVLEARLERGDAIVALGGGVVGDLAGFAAAIVRRGMSFVQVPTSLLAQVDSSVGGKTGINSRFGKNLIGAFHQPALVIADVAALDTLPRREFAAGYAEVVKYGLLGDAGFFAWLEANRADVFDGGPARTRAIAESCRTKARIVALDELEQGDRALLNLGHTFGHALEAAAGFDPDRLVHGEAVALGMALAHRFSAELGIAPPADAERVARHLGEAGLPTALAQVPGAPFSADELMTHIAQDKKVRQGRLTFILTRGIGQAFVARDVDPRRVRDFLHRELSG